MFLILLFIFSIVFSCFSLLFANLVNLDLEHSVVKINNVSKQLEKTSSLLLSKLRLYFLNLHQERKYMLGLGWTVGLDGWAGLLHWTVNGVFD